MKGEIMDDSQAYRIAVAGVALGLLAFLIGAAVVAATGHSVPAEYWTTGSAISGALLGLLAPTPSTPKSKAAAAATKAAEQANKHAEVAAVQAPAAEAAGPAAETTRAALSAQAAAAVANADLAKNPPEYTGVLPAVLLIAVAAAAIVTGAEYDLIQLQALAAGALGALIGIITPPPTKAG
jgi:hypothetical protein